MRRAPKSASSAAPPAARHGRQGRRVFRGDPRSSGGFGALTRRVTAGLGFERKAWDTGRFPLGDCQRRLGLVSRRAARAGAQPAGGRTQREAARCLRGRELRWPPTLCRGQQSCQTPSLSGIVEQIIQISQIKGRSERGITPEPTHRTWAVWGETSALRQNGCCLCYVMKTVLACLQKSTN